MFSMRRTVLAVAIGCAIAATAGRARAAPGALSLAGLTAPGGQIYVGGQVFTSDHNNGFCEVVNGAIVVTTCKSGLTATGPDAAAQPVYDAATGYVYVPDEASTSQGVWRFRYDPVARGFGPGVVIAPGRGVGGIRPVSAALGDDGNLYVTGIKSPTILRITNPGGVPGAQAVVTIGQTSDGSGGAGLAFFGADLYVAEKAGVTKLAGAAACLAGCVPSAAPISASLPTALAAIGNALYVADTPLATSSVLRFFPATGQEDLFAVNVVAGAAVYTLSNVSFLGADEAGNVVIDSDKTAGAGNGAAEVFLVAAAYAGDVPGAPPPPPPPGAGAQGELYAGLLSAPQGAVWMGSALWVSDAALGFCRVDAVWNPVDGHFEIFVNATTCDRSAVEPGQPAFDPATNLVYVPDKGAGSRGIWRLAFDPATNTVSQPFLLAAGKMAGLLPVSVALGPDGALYAGVIKNGTIYRITGQAGAVQTVAGVARTAAAHGPDGGIAFVGADLYLAEGDLVSVLRNATACTGKCLAVSLGGALDWAVAGTFGPSAIASDGGKLFIAKTSRAGVSTVVMYDPATPGVLATLSETGVVAGANVRYMNARALAFGPSPVPGVSNLYVGEDASNGLAASQGRVFRIGPPGGIVEFTLPPVGPAALFLSGVTAPIGSVWMGSHLWVSDHVMGFCRVDHGPQGSYLEPTTCVLDAASAAQMSFDAARNLVYVPDNSRQSIGVWRYAFDPLTETLTAPTPIASPQLASLKPTGTAIAADGTLYVSGLKNGTIYRIANGATAPAVTKIGASSDGGRVAQLAMVGADLYLAEGAGVSKIANVAACTGACTGVLLGSSLVTAPGALTSDGTYLYVSEMPIDVSTVVRIDPVNLWEQVYATQCVVPNYWVFIFTGVSSLASDPAGNLYVADDPTDGAILGQGHVFWVRAGSAGEGPWTVMPGGNAGVPPRPVVIPPAVTTGALYATGLTAPKGMVPLGDHLWVIDALKGFCRVDGAGPGGLGRLPGDNCVRLANGAAVPVTGQPVAAGGMLYMPSADGIYAAVVIVPAPPAPQVAVVDPATLVVPAAAFGGVVPTVLADGGGTLFAASAHGQIVFAVDPLAGTATIAGLTSPLAAGVAGMTVLNGVPYLAEVGLAPPLGVTAFPAGCALGTCVAADIGATLLGTPGAMVNDGTYVYVVDEVGLVGHVQRLDPVLRTQDLYANTGVFPDDTTMPFWVVTALAVNGHDLIVASDPGAALVPPLAGQGYLWGIVPPVPFVAPATPFRVVP